MFWEEHWAAGLVAAERLFAQQMTKLAAMMITYFLYIKYCIPLLFYLFLICVTVFLTKEQINNLIGCWFVPSLARQHSKLFLNPCCFPFSSVFSASCCFLILYNPGWDLRLQDQPFPWFIQLVVMLAGLVGWLCSNLLLAHLFLLTFVFSVCCCLLQFHLGRVVPETLLWLSSTFHMSSFHKR